MTSHNNTWLVVALVVIQRDEKKSPVKFLQLASRVTSEETPGRPVPTGV